MSDASEYRALHKAADTLEVRMENEFLRAVEEAQKKMDVDKIAMALVRGNVDNVMKLIPDLDLYPLQKTSKEAFGRGGRFGAKQINALKKS